MSEREYRDEADTLLVSMQSGLISYQEYTHKQRQLVDRFYASRICQEKEQQWAEGLAKAHGV
jgi:hypothetical protein